MKSVLLIEAEISVTKVFITAKMKNSNYFAVMETFVTDISDSTGRNDFIFDIWLWHGDLYCVSPFQVYHTSTDYKILYLV
jgi:hypothetical protein